MDFQFSHNALDIASALERRDGNILRRVGSALWRGALEVSNEAKQRMPKFRSELATATGVERHGPLEQHVTFNKEHAIYVERGTNPGGRPPLAEMVDWIRMKNITPRTPGVTRRQLAYLIRQSIAARGIPAQPFAAPSLSSKRDRVNDLIRTAVSRGLAGGAE